MLLNVSSLGATQLPFNNAVDRSWIVKGVGGGNRPSATENVDFRLSESDTKMEILVHQYLAYRMVYGRAAKGRNLCFRVYFPFETQIAVWGAGNAFSTRYPAGWHLVQCEYMANGYCRYTVDGVVRYGGTIFGVPDFYGVGTGTVLFDVGNRGGSLPQHYEWW